MAEETSGSIGTARIDVTVNTETMQPGIAAAKRAVSGMGDQASKEFDKATASNQRYASSLIRQAELLGKSRAEQIAYNAQTRIGGELGDKIAAKALANQAKMASSLGGTAKTAKELQFAMRGLPAQFTDIFVSLASGQRPLTVLLQQGGQLKDMFGGIKPAAAALGRSLLGLINPFTVTAAAATALFVAWKQGSDEAVAYNKALITTGNYAGLTAESLGQMAKAIGDTAGTQHQAAAALAEVAGSGKFTAEQIGLVGRAALAMSELTGQATSETIKQFEDLGKKPVEAILKLNDSQHFLTAAIYEQIKALEDQGRTQDAAQLAMQTYSDTVEKRRADVVENLGLIEQSWRGIKNAALEAGDAAMNVGRQMSDQQKFDVLVENRNAAKDLIDRGMGGSSFYGTTAEKFYKDATDKLLAMQDERIAKEKEQARRALEERLVQDKADSDREVEEFATNAQKRETALIKVKGEYNDRIARAFAAGDKKLAAELQASEKLVLAGVANKYKDPKTPKPKEVSAFESFRSYVNNLEAKSISADTSALTKYEQGIASLADQLNKYISKGGDAAKAAALFNEGQQALQKTLEAGRAKETAQVTAYKRTLDDMLETRQRAIDLQVASLGMGQREIDQQQALIGIDEDYNRKKADLQKRQQDTTSALEREGYQQQLDDLEKYHTQRIQMEVDGWKRSEEARKNAALGARAAIKDFEDAAGDVAGQTYDVFSNAFDGMSDAIAKFVQTGKLDFSELATSIIADLAKMEARILVSQALQSIFGGYGGTNGQGGVTYNDQGFVNHVYAKGGVVDGSRNLSAYSGSVVDRPTLFAFAKGNGLMGEAGPEAIMPLRRGPDGKLGVAATGGGSGGDVQVEVNITNNGQAVQAQQTGTRRDGQKVIVDMVLDAVASDIATGGRTSKAMQQRYGLQRRGVPVGG